MARLVCDRRGQRAMICRAQGDGGSGKNGSGLGQNGTKVWKKSAQPRLGRGWCRTHAGAEGQGCETRWTDVDGKVGGKVMEAAPGGAADDVPLHAEIVRRKNESWGGRGEC